MYFEGDWKSFSVTVFFFRGGMVECAKGDWREI